MEGNACIKTLKTVRACLNMRRMAPLLVIDQTISKTRVVINSDMPNLKQMPS
jgi:hypothetical protein